METATNKAFDFNQFFLDLEVLLKKYNLGDFENGFDYNISIINKQYSINDNQISITKTKTIKHQA